MIGEVIKRAGEKGSGGDRSAFRPGMIYVCSKAARIEMRNIASEDWQDAIDDMLLAVDLNTRVQKPFYHLVLSWHELEQPNDEQMFQAAEQMIIGLGLSEHQIVIASHHDTPRKHIHLIINTVHPTSGAVWSKSNDHMRIEKICREIELKQGWSHDRGRFDFEATSDGTVKLMPNPENWSKKEIGRREGKRFKTSGDRKFEKSAGFESFSNSIPPALKKRFSHEVENAKNWQSLHRALRSIGLTYYKYGSGARIGIVGSSEFAKASVFGSKFSISKMQKRFGFYEEPESDFDTDIHVQIAETEFENLTGFTDDEDIKATRSSAFKMTLIRRMYCNIYLNPIVSNAIKLVDLKNVPPSIIFRDDTAVRDHGGRLSTSKNTHEARATMIALAKSKGWSSVKPSGSAEFISLVSLQAAREGLRVFGVPDDLQSQCDAILKRLESQQSKIEALDKAAHAKVQGSVTERDQHLDANARQRTKRTAAEQNATATAKDVLKKLGRGTDPVRSALRQVAAEEEKRVKASFSDSRTVSTPQSAPDVDRRNNAKIRRISENLHENERGELDRMKQVHIGEVAALGGWSFAPKHQDGHNDRSGNLFRTYVRGDETIKATKKGTVWVYTNNKSGDGGSVVDLWFADNPAATLGDARKFFREVFGARETTPASVATKPIYEEPRDHTYARKRWEEAPFIEEKHTYAQERGISNSTLHRFRDQVRAGAFGGVYFAHRNWETGQILGFEQHWKKDGVRNTARFCKGGVKTVSVLGDPESADRVIFFEGGLDALARAEIEKREDTLYVSTGGGFGQKTVDAILQLSQNRKAYSGFDNDDAGEALHKKLLKMLTHVERLAPPQQIHDIRCKDWLDVLNALKSHSSDPSEDARDVEQDEPNFEM